MYYMMHCFSPDSDDLAMLTHRKDHPLRAWHSAAKFAAGPGQPPFRSAPPQPLRAEVKPGYSGVMAEFWDVPLPLMTKRLYKALHDAGVDNVDTYEAEIVDPATGSVNKDYVAFNIVGKVSAADLGKSKIAPGSTDRMTSVDFDSVTIEESKPAELLVFRLAEAVNAIVVHDRVKTAIEAAGIDTLTFIEPEDWAG